MGLKQRNKHMIHFILSILLFFLFFAPGINAEGYFADIDISVDTSGFVTITGTTNHQELLTESTETYVSKDQSLWLLNITKNEVFSDYIYTITFPKGTSINYIKSSGTFRIGEHEEHLIVDGFGENNNLSVIVQYQIDKYHEGSVSNAFDVNLGLIILISILIFLFILAYYKYPDKKESSEMFEDDMLKGLNQRQKEIMNILINNNAPLTQSDIQKEIGIPKASVSRNIQRLEFKGLIEKEQTGMSNLIRLKDK